ncbi:transcriptional regulator, MerR family [Alloactinosynnema sp. L-07]|nr:transcriptional regulator, MerR family [Alloactinosynnema sp. L-07]
MLERLRPEFPDVTISKIRFLEAEGLVTPQRTPSGYRRFTEDDIARLRFVLAAQRDHYLPLRVIKDQLDQADRGGAPPLAAVARQLSAVPTEVSDTLDVDEAPALRLTRAEVAAKATVEIELLDELEQYGLLAADDGGFYDGDAVRVARLAADLAEYGIEPRHLRAFRAAADRELGLVEQVVAPLYRQRDPSARERADAVTRELGTLAVGLHSLLVQAGLRRMISR